MPDYELELRLYVCDQEMSPEEVTAVLGLEPDKVSRRGARIQEPPKPRFNVWRLSSPADPEDSSPAEQWNALWQKLEPYKDRFDDLPPSVTRSLVLVLYAHKYIPGLGFPVHTMSQIAALGIPLEIDIHDLIEADEEDPSP